MANEPVIKLACGNYDRTRSLLEGRVQLDGWKVQCVSFARPSETFWRMIRHQEFDVSEMSLSAYLITRDKEYPRFVAIPVFPSRTFRHRSIYVRSGAHILEPSHLAGKRIGVPEYHMTAAVWVRGMLEEEYGVAPETITWVVGGQNRPGREERVELNLSSRIRLERLGQDQTLDSMLDTSDLDGIISPSPPASFQQGSAHVRRLFVDYRAEEERYFQRTGIFPIMHSVVIREDVVHRYPKLPGQLFEAFLQARDDWYKTLTEVHEIEYGLPWFSDSVEEAQKLLGNDFYPYGLEQNRKVLDKLMDYSYRQGLIRTKFDVDDLFVHVP